MRDRSDGPQADTLVLCYHAISARWPADLAVTLGRFQTQLEWLVTNGYRGATFSEAVLMPASARTVAVTFDDAFRSVFDHAAPLMASLGLPGTVFAVTDFVDSGRALTWPSLDRPVGRSGRTR
jgi:peptidoglycan/xylan/chitin deacetylase (PgdA/CDA1 family)